MPYFSKDELATLRQTFEREGYLVFPNLVPRAELAALRTRVLGEFERTRHSGELFQGGGSISGHLNCFPGVTSRFAYEALCERGILDVIAAVHPKQVRANHVGCNINIPGSAPQHYHIDGLWAQDFMIANVAVVDTDLVNGAIDLLPGTHKKFYRYWQFSVDRLPERSRRISMKQGDVLIRTSRLWHRGMPNHSTVPRPMFAVTFSEEDTGDPFMKNEGKINFYENWYKTNLLGRLSERTFVAAPFTYNAWRFVRSMFTDKGYAA